MDHQILVREYYAGCNGAIPYFLGRTTASLPFSLTFLLMGVIPYFMVHTVSERCSVGFTQSLS